MGPIVLPTINRSITKDKKERIESEILNSIQMHSHLSNRHERSLSKITSNQSRFKSGSINVQHRGFQANNDMFIFSRNEGVDSGLHHSRMHTEGADCMLLNYDSSA